MKFTDSLSRLPPTNTSCDVSKHPNTSNDRQLQLHGVVHGPAERSLSRKFETRSRNHSALYSRGRVPFLSPRSGGKEGFSLSHVHWNLSAQLEGKKRKKKEKKAATPVTEDVGSFVLPDFLFNAVKEEDERALNAECFSLYWMLPGFTEDSL